MRRGSSNVFALALALAMTAAPALLPATGERSAHAQTAGASAHPSLVARGQQLFDDQQYEESLQVLSAALVRPGNTAPQRIEIYRLLAYNYITLGRHDEAESACRGIFSLDPSYKLSDRESPRFRDFFLVAKKRWESDGRPGLVKPTEAPAAAVTMRHASPPSADKGTEIPLTAHLDDPQRRITEVKLFYRSGSKGRFTSLTAQLNVPEGSVRATIPHTAVMPPLVEYYLQGTDATGLAVVSRGDAAAPLRVAIPDSNKGWVLPVAITGSVLGAGAVVGILALAGVFKSSGGHGSGTPQSTVTVSVGDGHHFGSF
jgi:hypothetical protein